MVPKTASGASVAGDKTLVFDVTFVKGGKQGHVLRQGRRLPLPLTLTE